MLSAVGSSTHHGKSPHTKSEEYLESLEFGKEGEVEIEWRSYRKLKWSRLYLVLNVLSIQCLSPSRNSILSFLSQKRRLLRAIMNPFRP